VFQKCTLSPTRKADAVGLILSFWPEWGQKLSDNEIRVVYRKCVAIIDTPSVLYAYLNKPVQKIIGRATIERIARHHLDECLSMGEQSGYSSEDIKDYVGTRAVIVYSIGPFELATRPIPLKDLKANFDFVPTPQAVLLNAEGMAEIDARLGFKKR
jgi:predicted transcriptional regulator